MHALQQGRQEYLLCTLGLGKLGQQAATTNLRGNKSTRQPEQTLKVDGAKHMFPCAAARKTSKSSNGNSPTRAIGAGNGSPQPLEEFSGAQTTANLTWAGFQHVWKPSQAIFASWAAMVSNDRTIRFPNAWSEFCIPSRSQWMIFSRLRQKQMIGKLQRPNFGSRLRAVTLQGTE
jgi:hypothetical protein